MSFRPVKIFLSHIHEERDLAVLIKEAIEAEFSGFVEVFVSSDGSSIPSGTNFLRRIEDGLVNCVGAIYLVSPTSVTRSWISFELGAVWVRSALSVRAGKAEIPALPFCHSGMTPGGLPQPIGSLNAVRASSASDLKTAFTSLQAAVGAKGAFRTDFADLAGKILALETCYTVGDKFVGLLRAIGSPEHRKALVEQCLKLGAGSRITIDCGIVPNEIGQQAFALEQGALKGQLHVTKKGSGQSMGDMGTVSGPMIDLVFPTDLVIEYQARLLAL